MQVLFSTFIGINLEGLYVPPHSSHHFLISFSPLHSLGGGELTDTGHHQGAALGGDFWRLYNICIKQDQNSSIQNSQMKWKLFAVVKIS